MEQVQVTSKKRGIRVYDSSEIVITAKLAKEMDIKPGDRVALFIDRSRTSLMEMYLAKSETGLEVRPYRNKKSNTCCIYSKEYADIILQGKKKGIFRIGEILSKDGVDYHTIIYLKNYAQ